MTDRLLCRTVAMHTLLLLPAPIKHFVCLAWSRIRNIVKVHCNLRLVDNIETIGHSDANIDWSSSDEDLDA